MKKLLFLLSASLLVLTSCSEEAGPTSLPTVLLKKTIETFEDGSVITTNYTYNGNKLVSVVNDDILGSDVYFTYTGDLITKMEYKLSNGTIEQANSYQYDSNNKLMAFVRLDPLTDSGTKETYEYNSNDGSVSIINYTGNLIEQTELNGTGTINFENGEVSQFVTSYGSNYIYTYDSMNNALKNILGMYKISFVDSEADGVLHNIISETDDTSVINYSYTYNSNNYPLTGIETDASGEVTTIQYFYQ